MIVDSGRAVQALGLGIGEIVSVTTKMGNHVVEGEVVSTTRLGAVVRAGGKDMFCRDEFHTFVPQHAEQPPPMVPVDNVVLDVDARVQEKLKLSEQEDEGDADEDDKKDGMKQSKSVSPQGLPQDIQQAIVSSRDLTAEQVNKVLSEISNAAMKSMKRIGVQEIEIYPMITKIQNSISEVFGFEPVKLEAKPKKEKKDESESDD